MMARLFMTTLLIATISASCDSNYRVQTNSHICNYKLTYVDKDNCNNAIFINCSVKEINSTGTIVYNSKAETVPYCCDPSVYNMFCSYSSSPSYLVIVIIALSSFLCLFMMSVCLYRLKDEICKICCFCCFRESRQVINSHPGLQS